MTDDLPLSVIIPAINAMTTLGQQLDALLAQTGEFEVLVCDNGSSDGTRELVDGRHAADQRVKLVDASGRKGSAHARNVGIKQARSSQLAFCDADDVLGDSWVSAMTTALASHEFVTGPIELDRLNTTDVLASRGRWLERNLPTVFDGVFPFVSSCNLGLRRDALHRVGNFDEEFLYGQDIELSMRLWVASVALVIAPDAVVHYRYRAEQKQMFLQGFRHGRTRPHLHARLREKARSAYAPRFAWRDWAGTMLSAPSALRHGPGRSRWLWRAGSLAGHLRGSLAARVICLR